MPVMQREEETLEVKGRSACLNLWVAQAGQQSQSPPQKTVKADSDSHESRCPEGALLEWHPVRGGFSEGRVGQAGKWHLEPREAEAQKAA